MNLFHLESRNPPGEIYSVIEVPRDSKNKYEYNCELGFMELERISHTSFVSPVNYGFVPRTWTEDGAPLDIMVLTQMPIEPGVVVNVVPIGYLDVVARGRKDPKILSVAKNDPQYNHMEDIEHIPKHLLEEIAHFFRRYRELEGRDIVVGEWYGKKEAQALIMGAFRDYDDKFFEN